MSKKVLLIIGSILAVVVIAGAAVGGLVLLQGSPQTEETPTAPAASEPSFAPDQQEAQATPDLSLDLKACTIVDKSAIETAFPASIGTIRDADNRGVGYEPGGARSQSCVYRLEDGQALTNRFTVTVTTYADASAVALAKEGYTDSVETSLPGAEAFSYNEASDLSQLYSVIIFTGTSSALFALQLPTNQEAISSADASAALIRLANRAQL